MKRAIVMLGLDTLLLTVVSGTVAIAGGSKDLLPATISDKYRTECASCHLAYPPAMLPLASWRRLMGNLDNHYGVDASLEPAEVL